ncbi:MAG: phosphomannomutase/phosphoglucomutase [Clostridiales bacterium]|nr:phosphomannomutase/phosphoglucomutase [Clostridiales bacterium]
MNITKDEFLKLKSGTDIRGTAVETKDEKMQLTDEAVFLICAAFVKWLKNKYSKENLKIAVGHDSRISAERIKKSAVSAFNGEGAFVYDCGLSSTPAMFMALVLDIQADASLEITASHHPYQRNGLKFFTPDGGLEASDVEEILNIAYDIIPSNLSGKIVKYDFMSVYCRHLREIIINGVNSGIKPLKGLKISVDAGNGVGGFYAKEVLAPLGADVSASQFLEPNGMFPNHIPNPENALAIKSASEMVKKSNSDFGLIFDTDVDRMGCIASDGKEINRNRLVALASVIALQNNKGATIVTDSLTSDGLKKFIEELGGKQLRYKRGYKNVIDKAIELNDKGVNSPLAIETSGHAALKENYFLDDGAYLAAKIIILLAELNKNGRKIEDLISTLTEPSESIEVRIPINLSDFRRYGENVIESLKEYAASKDGFDIEKENYEGVRINFNGGWFLLRLSVHDPILPLNIESDIPGTCHDILKMIYEFMLQFDKLDLSDFKRVL